MLGKSLISMVHGFQQAIERMTPEGKCWTSFGFFWPPRCMPQKVGRNLEKFGRLQRLHYSRLHSGLPSGVIQHGLLENGPLISDFPNKTSIHKGFSSQPCLMKPEGTRMTMIHWNLYQRASIIPKAQTRKLCGAPRTSFGCP